MYKFSPSDRNYEGSGFENNFPRTSHDSAKVMKLNVMRYFETTG